MIRFDDVSERGGIDEYENEKDMILQYQSPRS